ncbi:cytochrome c3 family protein [Geomonas sp. Red32]|uniref:cytochrome c3 family protein n=1 Tax=Geomonas sp. Red32 TaxID=2912856 RepID=UPI00202CD223|nr:cytochrome c3 family protein [Geomonas sp. Red32]MCM0084036.1 cytochrome c3 family protein [Geomonas sp. Red32]
MRRFWGRLAAAGALLTISLVLVPGLARAEFKCSSCHRGLITGSVAHPPVAAGECTHCHRQLSDAHPLEKGSMGFVVPREKLCLHCHTKLLTDSKPFFHKPVAEGKCTGCHNHHSSDYKALLKDAPPNLCFRCHDQTKFTGAAFTHKPVAEGKCLACHEPHQATGRYLLRKPGSELCLMCHDKKYATGKSIHGPIKTGECTKCHLVHGSPNRKLLKAEMPTELYRPFTPDAFPLCFYCHNPDLVSEVKTTKTTGFRNGDRNLHAVHVNKPGKGRSCLLCHNPHASSQDRLIYTHAPGFGSWQIPIRYTKTDTGGQCSVGCHKTYRYDRGKALDNN